MDLRETVRKILEKNEWLNGWYDYLDGDIMAIVDKPEKFQFVKNVKSLKELYRLLRNLDGVFKYRNLLFFNDWQYGTFVYDIRNPEDYVDHLTIDAMDYRGFRKTISQYIAKRE